MSANRNDVRNAILFRQRKFNPFEKEKLDTDAYQRRLKIIDDYFNKNASLHQDHPRFRTSHSRQDLWGVLEWVYGRNLVLICIDIESYERATKNSLYILEVGIAIYDPRGQQHLGTPNIKTFHLVLDNNLLMKNGRYVPNHREYFMGRELWRMSRKSIVSFTQGLLDYYDGLNGWPAVLVGHGVQNDIKYLKRMGIDVPQWEKIDTQALFAYGRNKTNKTNLRTALKETLILSGYMHNGGNDAYLTLQLLFKLGDPEIRTLLKLDIFDPPKKKAPKLSWLSEKTPTTMFAKPEALTAVAFAFPEPIKVLTLFFDEVYDEVPEYEEDLDEYYEDDGYR